MNKIVVLCGLVMLGITTTPQENNIPENCDNEAELTNVMLVEQSTNPLHTKLENSIWDAPKLVTRVEAVSSELDINEIEYIEEQQDFELGFDTKEYLPKDFDPNTAYFDLNSVTYLEESSTDLGFDSAAYLPDNFDPYAYPQHISGFNYIEEEDLFLGFDTASYLPVHFDAHEFYFDLDSVEYIEEEEEIDFELAAEYYLPSANPVPSSK